MNCSPSDLKDYFFDELPAAERRAVETHVSTCADCREQFEALRVTGTALLSVRDEEPPRRIAFVSDPVFEPTWWQRVWNSGPRLGFASAAMLTCAILGHGVIAESRNDARLQQIIAEQKRLEEQHRTTLAAFEEYVTYQQKRLNMIQRANYSGIQQ